MTEIRDLWKIFEIWKYFITDENDDLILGQWKLFLTKMKGNVRILLRNLKKLSGKGGKITDLSRIS